MNKKEYTRGFNTAYTLRKYKGVKFVERFSGAINKQESDYSRGFIEGLAQLEKDEQKAKEEIRERQYKQIEEIRMRRAMENNLDLEL